MPTKAERQEGSRRGEEARRKRLEAEALAERERYHRLKNGVYGIKDDDVREAILYLLEKFE